MKLLNHFSEIDGNRSKTPSSSPEPVVARRSAETASAANSRPNPEWSPEPAPPKHHPPNANNATPRDEDPVQKDLATMFEFTPQREYPTIIVNAERPLSDMPLINSYFDNIYVVNLAHRRTRRIRIIQELNRLNIRAEIFEAENGYLPENVEAFTRYFSAPVGGPDAHPLEIANRRKIIRSPGAWGCLLTYRRILEDAQRRGFKRILCLEDDVIFHINFHRAFESWIRSIGEDWRMLYLGASQHTWDAVTGIEPLPSGDPTETPRSYHPKRTDGSFAIAFDSRIFSDLISEIGKMNCTVDSGPYRAISDQNPGRCFVAYPNLAIADLSDSDTGIPRSQAEFAARFRWNLDLYEFPPAHDLVSVIMPAFNAARTIEKSIRSILDQSYPDLELIVADDASSDSTRAIVERIARKDRRVHLLRHTRNRGCYAARNSALRASRGRYIAIQDSDDISLRTRIERQIIPIILGKAEVTISRIFRSRCSIDELRPEDPEAMARLVLSRRRERDKYGNFVYRDRPILGLNSSMFDRGLFEELGLFWEHPFGGDAEILERLIFARMGKLLTEADQTVHAFLSRVQTLPGIFERIESVQLISSDMTGSNLTNRYSPEVRKQFEALWRKKLRGELDYEYPRLY